LTVLNDDRFVAQLNRNDLAQLHNLCPRSLLQIGSDRFFFQLGIRSIRQNLGEIFDLIVCQSDAAVRREGADLCQDFAAMNQISAANGDLDWPERVSGRAGGNNLARTRGPRFIRLRPGRIEDDHLCFTETGGQRELLIADADPVRLQKRSVTKHVHAESRNVDDNACVRRHRVGAFQLSQFSTIRCVGVRLAAPALERQSQ